MTDILERLRNPGCVYGEEYHDDDYSLYGKAADEIERLRTFIGRRFPGFDIDEALTLFDTPPETET
jgi:hypothetical protein